VCQCSCMTGAATADPSIGRCARRGICTTPERSPIARIPLRSQLEEEFRSEVIGNFLSEFAPGGRRCLRAVQQRPQFRHLAARALRWGRTVATGHYARTDRIRTRAGGGCCARSSGEGSVLFLFDLSQEQLGMADFPAGGDAQGRRSGRSRRAIILRTPTARPAGHLLRGGRDYREFVSDGSRDTGPPGDIVDTRTGFWGEHRARLLHRRTARGLEFASDRPLYVHGLDGAATV